MYRRVRIKLCTVQYVLHKECGTVSAFHSVFFLLPYLEFIQIHLREKNLHFHACQIIFPFLEKCVAMVHLIYGTVWTYCSFAVTIEFVIIPRLCILYGNVMVSVES